MRLPTRAECDALIDELSAMQAQWAPDSAAWRELGAIIGWLGCEPWRPAPPSEEV